MAAQSKRRIGYVDFKLDNFHAEIYLKHTRGALAARGFEIAACHAMHEEESRQWAKANAIPYFSDLNELNAAVDYFCILAPSNPETHLDLCRKIFPFGKPTYVDKTFAPNLAIAQEIFALADRHGVPMQTTSALRYTAVQQKVSELGRENLRHAITWAPGQSFGEYGIHAVEMLISCMGPNATRLMRRGSDELVELLIDFTGNRTASANVYMNNKLPYSAVITSTTETHYFAIDTSRLFIDMASAMFDFFESGKPNIDRRESLMIRRILDAANQPAAVGQWITL